MLAKLYRDVDRDVAPFPSSSSHHSRGGHSSGGGGGGAGGGHLPHAAAAWTCWRCGQRNHDHAGAAPGRSPGAHVCSVCRSPRGECRDRKTSRRGLKALALVFPLLVADQMLPFFPSLDCAGLSSCGVSRACAGTRSPTPHYPSPSTSPHVTRSSSGGGSDYAAAGVLLLRGSGPGLEALFGRDVSARGPLSLLGGKRDYADRRASNLTALREFDEETGGTLSQRAKATLKELLRHVSTGGADPRTATSVWVRDGRYVLYLVCVNGVPELAQAVHGLVEKHGQSRRSWSGWLKGSSYTEMGALEWVALPALLAAVNSPSSSPPSSSSSWFSYGRSDPLACNEFARKVLRDAGVLSALHAIDSGVVVARPAAAPVRHQLRVVYCRSCVWACVGVCGRVCLWVGRLCRL